MTKNVTICFRTGDDLRKSLEKISAQERRSLSSLIENILVEYLDDEKQIKQIKEEKRRFPRKAVDAPALISGVVPDSEDLSAGVVSNLSISGLQISIPATLPFELKESGENARISVVFTLPETRKPLSVECIPQYVNNMNGETNIGASFCDSDFTSYQVIQNYLIN
jgi:hypothetical protein